jgi:hypothetical protein
MDITFKNNALLVGGKRVATFESERAFESVKDALIANLTRDAATLLALSVLVEATTAEVADFLGQDKSNTFRRLYALAEAGKAVIVDEAHHNGERGRPSFLWAIA